MGRAHELAAAILVYPHSASANCHVVGGRKSAAARLSPGLQDAVAPATATDPWKGCGEPLARNPGHSAGGGAHTL